MNKFKNVTIVSLMGLGLAAGCAKAGSSIDAMADTATGSVGCGNFQSKVFDSAYTYLEENQETPNLSLLADTVNQKIDELAIKQQIKDTEKLDQYKAQFEQLFKTLLSESADLRDAKTIKEQVQVLIELEMEDRSTAENMKLNSSVGNQFASLNKLATDMKIECNDNSGSGNTGGTTGGGTADEQAAPTAMQKRMVAGIENTFSTVYQSCNSLSVSTVTGSTPDVQGIKKLSTSHPDGVGGQRIVSDLAKVQSTHPYIKVAGAGGGNNCFNVKNNPLIYDYGGSPSVSNNVIDMFKNAGTGTEVLGVDCSALVSSMAAASGLRYKPGQDNKAIYIRQSSSKFISASASGFTCYQNVDVDKTSLIKTGDIAAVSGHVVMIDKVGEDPFGLSAITKAADCSKVTSSKFNFSVVQSSPSKNGMGINRYVAKDYLNESSKMKTLFVAYAKAACNAKFTGKKESPRSSSWGIVRHKGTSECLTTATELARQSCVSSCRKTF